MRVTGPLRYRIRRLCVRALSLQSKLGSLERYYSPTELVVFSESPWASWMDRLTREQPQHALAASADAPSAFLQMLAAKGVLQEAGVLRDAFAARGLRIADLSSARGTEAERAALTREAMASGADVIYQAPLVGPGRLYGIADFLVRVEGDGGAGSGGSGGGRGLGAEWHYTAWESKLASSPTPQQLLQLGCYAEMLREAQGVAPRVVSLVLGGGGGPTRLELRVADFAPQVRRVRERFAAFHASFDPSAMPALPAPGAPAGRWTELAAAQLKERDDIRLVARLSKKQAARLRVAGVGSATELAELGGSGKAAKLPSVRGVAPEALWRLHRQAALQLKSAEAPDAAPPYELLPDARAVLGALPPPSDADLFFDLEGTPFAASATRADGGGADGGGVGEAAPEVAPTSREYLWGVSMRGEDGGSGGEYKSWWAHDAAEERAAVDGFLSWAHARWVADPTLRIYHYGAYEHGAAQAYGAVRDARGEFDDLLRGRAFIDLYAVVRRALLLGTPSYSIKYV